MKEDAIKRFLDLVEKTGDKVIITDPAGEHPYVLMSLDQYERLATGSVSAAKTAVKEEKPPEAVIVEPTTAEKKIVEAPTSGLQPVKKDFALWRAQLGREAVADAPLREVSRPAAQRPRTQAAPANEFKVDSEGEEQFFLEPLE